MGQVVLTAAACWMAIAWALYQSLHPQPMWHRTQAELLLLAGVGVGLLHIVHLPTELVDAMSPQIAEILTVWNTDSVSATSPKPWSQISLATAESRLGLVTFLAYILIFLVTSQRLRHVHEVERMLRWVCVSVGAMAIYGLVQYLTSNGKFFWLYDYPLTNTYFRVKGGFSNKNHFAQFLALGIGPFIWWFMHVAHKIQQSRSQSFQFTNRTSSRGNGAVGLLLPALGIVVFAGLLSLSRGGVVAMFVAALVSMGILSSKGLVSRKLVAGLMGTGVLVGSCLFLLGYDAVARRLDNWDPNGRWQIWQANLATAADFPLFGTGIGSHAEAYPMYLDQPFDPVEYTHAESGYLQIVSETGLVGFALTLTAIGLCLSWCVRGILFSRSKRSTIALAAIAGSLAANCVHAFVDFVWYVPGCMVVVIILVACAGRLFQINYDLHFGHALNSSPWNRQLPRIVWAVSVCGLVGLGYWMAQITLPVLNAEPYWHEYLQLTFAQDKKQKGNRDPQSEGQHDQNLTFQQSVVYQKLTALKAAVEANPNNARIQLRMAMGYVSLFHALQRDSQNPMSLAQIRDAVWVSKFQSTTAMNRWLNNPGVIGRTRKFLDAALHHTRRALSLCPLQGHGYLNLAKLCFLEGKGVNEQKRYIDQALIVRPFDPRVLFAAGQQAWSSGEYKTAILYWKGSFQRSLNYQEQIMDMLVDYVPARFVIENFQPDWDTLVRLEQRYRNLNRPNDYQTILRQYAKVAVQKARQTDTKNPISFWFYAAAAFNKLGQTDFVWKCLRSAMKTDYHSFQTRYEWALWNYKQKKYAESIKHFSWCLNRRPKDEKIQRLLSDAKTAKLLSETIQIVPSPTKLSRL